MAKWYPGRRLSWFRLGILVLVITGLVGGGILGWARWQDAQAANASEPWFDAYVDVTATPSYPFESPGTDGQRNVALAFIVASRDDACTPSWGGAYLLDEAQSELDLDRRLARLRMLGGSAMVSFGGQANSDLALGCEHHDELTRAYEDVVDRYELSTIDMDIEGELLKNEQAVQRQARAIAEVQRTQASQDGLDVWLTLPVADDGLTFEGLQAVRSYLAAGVSIAGVNAMTMNFAIERGGSMRTAVERSLTAVHNQLRSLYQEVGTPIGDATAWTRVSATVMIGQNDVRSDVLTVSDARAISRFAAERNMARLSMWSQNRDRQCDANWPDPKVVSDACSGVEQSTGEFARTLRAQRPGNISQSAAVATPAKPQGPLEDDPETSPYPIWDAEAAYPVGSKIVWNHSVYEAKWWTQGDQPDLPTETGAQPWRLLGPVLPGEKPVDRPQLPADAYPTWQKAEEYQRGSRVIFDGAAYEAKWWTQGDSPDAALVRPNDSPWRQLTDTEVRAVLEDTGP